MSLLLHVVLLLAPLVAAAAAAAATDRTAVVVVVVGGSERSRLSAPQDESLRLCGAGSGAVRHRALSLDGKPAQAAFHALSSIPLSEGAHVLVAWTHDALADAGAGDADDDAGTERALLAAVDAIAAAHAAVTVLLPTGRAFLVSWLGDPAVSDHYEDDWRGFHPGTTLHELTHHDVEAVRSCFQAHLLAKGVLCRVLDEALLPDERIANVFDGGLARAAHSFVVAASNASSAAEQPEAGVVLPRFRFLQPMPAANREPPAALGVPPPPRKKWRRGCVAKYAARRRPVVWRHHVVNWTWDDVASGLLEAGRTLQGVKRSARGLFFDPIPTALMGRAGPAVFPQVDLEAVPYDVVNVTAMDAIATASGGIMQYFTEVPSALKRESALRELFVSDEDVARAQQFVWVSSPGQVTAAHFDQDFNVFVQVLGSKTFELWPPSTDMGIAPRISPWWHKSQLHREQLPAPRVVARLRAGDVLFVPPNWWHRVISETASRDEAMYEAMNAVYRMDHKFDVHLPDRDGRRFALRLYVDLLVQRVIGTNHTTWFVHERVLPRFDKLRDHLPQPAAPLCAPDARVPTCSHVFADCRMDAVIIAEHFAHQTGLVSSARDVLFVDFLEEVAASVVGVEHVYAFYRDCFRGQGYAYTAPGDEDHERLWRPPSEAEEEDEDEEGGGGGVVF